MNEAETRAEHIDPALRAAGWGVIEGSKVLREHRITLGRLEGFGHRAKADIADYVLVHRNRKLAVIEAKSWDSPLGEGVAQAKNYATRLAARLAYSTNGRALYEIDMETGAESETPLEFPTPDELWTRVFAQPDEWREKFDAVPFVEKGDSWRIRYYQEIAANRVLEKIASGTANPAQPTRILLTLATGTGKTSIAFEIAWKLFSTRWNLQRNGARQPRILFLADRNTLANQAFNDFTSFAAFDEDALVRIKPGEISKKGKVPTNGSIFFTIFQTFMCGPADADGNPTPFFGQYPKDFFDFIIVDECHRGGARDESAWRGILEYFSPAAQLGLTATPKRRDNVDTYAYFGEPVHVYSLKDGINDGFLTPFKVCQIQTTLDKYIHTPDDDVLEGEIEQGRYYVESDFNRAGGIEIKERERKRVEIFMGLINQAEKTLVFCATQEHALLIRDLINQCKTSRDPLYCVRVTSNDGELGEQYLRDFQDNEKTIPTILTTSQKLSTGVDARNVRNIVLLRPVNSMIEFKQIIGRGTRLYDGKDFFTIYDFVGAHEHFADPEWDGEPVAPEPPVVVEPRPPRPEPPPGPEPPPQPRGKIKVRLADGKEREIQHMAGTSYWSPDGRPVSAQMFLENLFGEMPAFFRNEAELRAIWSAPDTRQKLLNALAEKGYGPEALHEMQRLVNAEKSDLYDVLAYVAFRSGMISRQERAARAGKAIDANYTDTQQAFLQFVLSQYVKVGVTELAPDKLAPLLKLKYKNALADAIAELGEETGIKRLFSDFQRHLYSAEPSPLAA